MQRHLKQNGQISPGILLFGSLGLIILIVVGTLAFRFLTMPKGGFNFTASVTTTPVKVDTIPIVYQTVGSLESVQEATLRSEVNTIVEKILFKEGDIVQKGQILIQLQSDKQQAGVTEAEQSAIEGEAGFLSAEASYHKAVQDALARQSDFEMAHKEYQRYKGLFEKGFVSAHDFDQRKANFDRKKALLEAATQEKAVWLSKKVEAEARATSAGARVSLSKAQYGDTTIRAPFAGTVGARYISEGDSVLPTDKLVDIVKTNPLQMMFQIPERYLSRLAVGQKVSFETESYPEKEFQGKLTFVAPNVRSDTRSILVKADIDNTSNQLRSGQYGVANITFAQKENAILVPEESIVPLGEKYYVYTTLDKKAHLNPVQVGQRLPGWVEILSGIKATDKVITGGLQKVQDGMGIEDVTEKLKKQGSE